MVFFQVENNRTNTVVILAGAVTLADLLCMINSLSDRLQRADLPTHALRSGDVETVSKGEPRAPGRLFVRVTGADS